jgi:hypothetical protein
MQTAAEILSRHPQGCWVFDATGRLISGVFACNPDTGEVVMMSQASSPLQWLIMLLPRPRPAWTFRLFRTDIPTRHGFWPAPLHVVPKPSHDPFLGGRVPDGQAYIVGNGEPEVEL